MKKRNKVVLGIVAIVVIMIIGLWGIDFGGYLSVSEAKNPQYVGRDVEVKGIVKEGTLKIDVHSTSFVLTDGKADIQVEYIGDRPVNVAEGKDVVVYGKLISNEEIEARKIILGCPSKYVGY
ncbi:MAG: cytochrome c maturation protein CcmE [Methanocellales archaeon]|nr:cytochrome c maturation protein CcmE [Methanocellales archaeon]